jgi:hypothetical protein
VQKKKEAVSPANKQRLGCWGNTLDNAPVNEASLVDTQSPISCSAWGARIEATLLGDLSEEERQSLAEHTLVCSACAALVRRYQFIEEFARQLPKYNLRKSDGKSSRTTYDRFNTYRTEGRSSGKEKLPFSALVVCSSFRLALLFGKHLWKFLQWVWNADRWKDEGDSNKYA